MAGTTFERGQVGDVVREIPTFSIKYNDVYSLKNLYIMMHELLLEEGWLGFEQDKAGEGHADLETLYSENVYQKGIHRGGKEIWSWWRTTRIQTGKQRPGYFLDALDIDWHGVYTQDSEAVSQGKKMKVNKGELEVFFKARIFGDIGHSWEHSKLMKNFKGIFYDRVYHHVLERRQKELWRDVYRLSSKFKAYLNLRTWAQTGEPFHPRQFGFGLPEQGR